MRKITFFILILTSVNTVAAEYYLIDATSKSSANFKSQLQARTYLKRYSDLSYQQQRELADEQNIEALFLQIREKLKINNPDSLLLLEKIYALRFQYEWSELQREVIKKSLLSLSALERDPLRQDKLKMEAQSFEAKRKKSGQQLKQLIPHGLTDKYSFFSINGKVFDFDEKLIFPRGEFRLGLYSDKYPAWFATVHMSELKQLQVFSKGIVTGNCETGFYMSSLNTEALTAKVSVAGDNCLLDLNQRPDLSTSYALEKKIEMPDRIKANHRWIWVAAGIIGGFIAYQNLKDKDNSTSTAEGF